MSDAGCHIKPANAGDVEAVADLAAGLAQSFPFSRTSFGLSYPALLATDDACLLLAVNGEETVGYLLGFEHLTFYANGPVGWVEEVFVRGQDRGRGAWPGPDERLRAVGGRPGLRPDRAGDPPGGALLPRAGIRGIRRLLPQDPGQYRPARALTTGYSPDMSVFTDSEIEYLAGQRLGRIATVGPDGQPHVVPTSFRYNAEHDTIDVGGMRMSQTKKLRDVQRSGRASIVIDDVLPPWQPRMIEVRGTAAVIPAGGKAFGERFEDTIVRIRPTRIIAFGIDPGDTASARSVSAT